MDLPRQPPPRLLPDIHISHDTDVLQACLSLAGEPGPDWAIRGGGTGVFFFTFELVPIKSIDRQEMIT